MDKLKPCPFCGSMNIAMYDRTVHCDNCRADGPRNKWNTPDPEEKEEMASEKSDYWLKQAASVLGEIATSNPHVTWEHEITQGMIAYAQACIAMHNAERERDKGATAPDQKVEKRPEIDYAEAFDFVLERWYAESRPGAIAALRAYIEPRR